MPTFKNFKHESFAREYRVARNATQAAIRAGYSQKSARFQGSRLLTNANILARILELTEADAKRNEVTVDLIIEEYRLLAYQPLNHPDVRPSDKRMALHDLGQHLGIFDKDKATKYPSESMTSWFAELSESARAFPVAQ